MSDDLEKVLRNSLDAVERSRKVTLFGVVALFFAMTIALAVLFQGAAGTAAAPSALALKAIYVAASAQMLFVACCTGIVMLQIWRAARTILRAIDIPKGQ
jgi:hypothetical protein